MNNNITFYTLLKVLWMWLYEEKTFSNCTIDQRGSFSVFFFLHHPSSYDPEISEDSFFQPNEISNPALCRRASMCSSHNDKQECDLAIEKLNSNRDNKKNIPVAICFIDSSNFWDQRVIGIWITQK